MAITLHVEGDIHPDGMLSENSYCDHAEFHDALPNRDYDWGFLNKARNYAQRLINSGAKNVSITQYDSQAGYGNPYSAVPLK